METKYVKSDFHLAPHRVHDNTSYLNFINPRITHRYGGMVIDNKIAIKGDTCNKDFETCSYLSKLDSWVKFINYVLGNRRDYYYIDNTLIKFDTIEQANIWFDSIYDVIVSNHANANLSTFLNGKSLPKGIIMVEHERNFKFYKVNNDFTVSPYDFTVELYNKEYKHTPNDLFKYNFDTMTYEPNLECKTWV